VLCGPLRSLRQQRHSTQRTQRITEKNETLTEE